MIGIYKITSPSGKIYIGQSIDIERRLRCYKRLNAKKQPRLYNSFIKYGYESHIVEVVLECLEEELNDKERYYQDLFQCAGKNGLNSTLTNSNDKSGKLSLEHRMKISNGCKNPSAETRKKMSNSRLGKKRSIEFCLKLSIIAKKRTHTPETKIRLAELARNMSDETRLKKSISATGNRQSEETKRKISETLKGRVQSEETRLKISSNHGTRVLNTETGEIYLSVAKAAKDINHNISWLHHKLKGNVVNNTNLKFA